MSRRPRRNHASAFKANVALAAIKGDRTLVQLAEQFDVKAVLKSKMQKWSPCPGLATFNSACVAEQKLAGYRFNTIVVAAHY
jgi:transposase-like protein